MEKWAPGLQIIAVRVTKPEIGKVIAKSYRKVERTKALFKVVEERQKVLVEKHRTKHIQQLQAAITKYEVRMI